MNLENVEAVKARIAEIRKRFVDPIERFSSSGLKFDGFLRRAEFSSIPTCPEDLEQLINRAAEKYGIDPSIIKAVISVESGFSQAAVSRVGAVGLMQIMPGTARALGINPNDPAENIDGGTRYLKQQLDRFGTLEKALAAYNAGPGAVIKYGGIPPYAETQKYVEAVLRRIDFYR